MSQKIEPRATAGDIPIDKIQVGISSCLLGQEVRFDGGHKRDSYITGTLSDYFDFVPICPEAAAGLGIPRRPIRLVQRDNGVRAVGVKTPDLDPTDELAAFGRRTAKQLGDISGYILKNRSPSCGMARVKVYGEKGMPQNNGIGIYAGELMKSLPLLPVEGEGRLGDPVLRENVIKRVAGLLPDVSLSTDGAHLENKPFSRKANSIVLAAGDTARPRSPGWAPTTRKQCRAWPASCPITINTDS